mmetsp:Transcript_45337/g.91470  ORF Transcript_45337/g.91470 Transcript_45337/m.91470 type:complete len:220 (+) Transcript_45337:275-934(+)
MVPYFSASVAYFEPATAWKFLWRSRSAGRPLPAAGVPAFRRPPSSSTSTKEAKAGGHHTSLKAMRLLNCRCATSLGGSWWQPRRQVDHEPPPVPRPSPWRDATAMPGPSWFPAAIPSTFPRFSLLDSEPAIAVRSQWFQSLKLWPVYPWPGAASGRSLRPPAKRICRLTVSQSPVSFAARARSRIDSILSTAVPGYSASTGPTPPSAPTLSEVIPIFCA